VVVNSFPRDRSFDCANSQDNSHDKKNSGAGIDNFRSMGIENFSCGILSQLGRNYALNISRGSSILRSHHYIDEYNYHHTTRKFIKRGIK